MEMADFPLTDLIVFLKFASTNRMERGWLMWVLLIGQVVFLNRFFPLEMREAKVLEFINFFQVNMSVNEYSLKLKQLSKYSQIVVVDPRS